MIKMEQTIVITTEENKKEILRENSRNHLFTNIKFFTFQDLKRNLFFDYDEQAILYVVRNYHVSVSVAKVYLEHLYFLKDLNYGKVKFLNQLKKDLDSIIYLFIILNLSIFFKIKKLLFMVFQFLVKKKIWF